MGSVFTARTEKRPALWIEAAGQIAQLDPKAVFVIIGGTNALHDAVGTRRSATGCDILNDDREVLRPNLRHIFLRGVLQCPA